MAAGVRGPERDFPRKPRNKIFVAGFSRGVEFSYLYAAMHPDRVQGIIALDGFIPLKPMSTAAVTPDHYADDIGGKHLTYDKRKILMQMMIENPRHSAAPRQQS